MKIYQKLVVVSAVLFMNSCQSKVSHDEALKFYVDIGIEMNEGTAKSNDFIHQFSEMTHEAGLRDDQKLFPSEFDSLTNLNNKIIQLLNLKIADVSKINEVDPALNLKEKVVHYLEDQKKSHETFYPVILKFAVTTGLGNLNNEQKETVNKIKEKIQEHQKASVELDQLETDFQGKYNLTDKEMHDAGLSEN